MPLSGHNISDDVEAVGASSGAWKPDRQTGNIELRQAMPNGQWLADKPRRREGATNILTGTQRQSARKALRERKAQALVTSHANSM